MLTAPMTARPQPAGPLPHAAAPVAGRTPSPDGALRALYAEHGAILLAYAERFTGDRGQAEDIVQEAFLRAWRNLDRLLADSRPVRVWLVHVTRNLLTDAARAARARPPAATAEADLPFVDADTDGGLRRLVDHAVLANAMQRLPATHRQVVVDTYFHDLPAAVTARRLGIPVGTVRSRLHYALRELRALLCDEDLLAA